jgi:hypothetical protein
MLRSDTGTLATQVAPALSALTRPTSQLPAQWTSFTSWSNTKHRNHSPGGDDPSSKCSCTIEPCLEARVINAYEPRRLQRVHLVPVCAHDRLLLQLQPQVAQIPGNDVSWNRKGDRKPRSLASELHRTRVQSVCVRPCLHHADVIRILDQTTLSNSKEENRENACYCTFDARVYISKYWRTDGPPSGGIR